MTNRVKAKALPLFFAGLLAAAPALPTGASAEPDAAVLAGQAKASVAAFASALKSELTAAMQAGGPLQAIEVCNSQAPVIAREVSLQQGMQVSRVSERNRNPGNAPTEWQAAVLREFQARLEAGEALDSLAWHDIAATRDGREFRFMQAIPTAPLCLACHGEVIAPPVAAKLAELYPDDQATGFREGDIRGAFVVTRSLD
jgi:Protein of unknown function (DUF3365)